MTEALPGPTDHQGNDELILFDPATGLVPAVLQDAVAGQVLMVGFLNRQALDRTRETGLVHFWSRSRNQLWQKGETSGNVSRVREIRVNCEQNSLLIVVDQAGAICHDGYASCYYRRLDSDQLTITEERIFDPDVVYGDHIVNGATSLAGLARLQFGAYQFLLDHDLSGVSSTSRRLRSAQPVAARIADELIELAGVLDGSHSHSDRAADVKLEAGQVIYWATLAAVGAGLGWVETRFDLALHAGTGGLPGDDELAAALLRGAAAAWMADGGTLSGRLNLTMRLVGQVLQVHQIAGEALIASDVAELRTKPYLEAYFATRP